MKVIREKIVFWLHSRGSTQFLDVGVACVIINFVFYTQVENLNS